MILELKGSQIMVDGESTVSDIRANISIDQRIMRLKFRYKPEDINKPIDLTLTCTKPKFSLPSSSIEIEGREILSDVYFKLCVSWHIIKGRWIVKGIFGDDIIDNVITSRKDLGRLVKSILK